MPSNIQNTFSSTLSLLRSKRNFQVQSIVDAKVQELDQFFSKSGLDVMVLAISGGLDSAVVLSLLKLTQIKKIVCIHQYRNPKLLNFVKLQLSEQDKERIELIVIETPDLIKNVCISAYF
jgi:NH3-dependent NAD+ synthetase